MSSAAEKHAKANTLSCVVGFCIGKVTTVELRNESHVTGRVVEVSRCINFISVGITCSWTTPLLCTNLVFSTCCLFHSTYFYFRWTDL